MNATHVQLPVSVLPAVCEGMAPGRVVAVVTAGTRSLDVWQMPPMTGEPSWRLWLHLPSQRPPEGARFLGVLRWVGGVSAMVYREDVAA